MTSYGFVHLEFGDQHRERSLQVLDKLRMRLAQKGDRFSSVIVDNAGNVPAESTSGTASEQRRNAPLPKSFPAASRTNET